MSLPPPEERFKERLIQFCEYVKGILKNANDNGIETPASPFVMDLIKNFVKKEEADKILATFLLRSYDNWEKVRSREKNFFRTDGLKAFHGIPEKSVDDFNKLFDVIKPNGEPLLDDSTMEGIWQLFESLIKTSVVFVHHQRCPDPVTKKYTKNYFPGMSIKKQVELWNITSLE